MTRHTPIVQHNQDGPLDPDFGKVVKETLEYWLVPGVAVAVVDGENTWTKGYGMATFPSTHVTPSTLYYAGSTTKAFTAAIMSFLVDDNEKYPHIQWDTPINQLIRDDFVLEDDYATNHITIEDALSHRSGLPGHDYSIGAPGIGIQSIVRNLRNLPMTAEPRTKYQYNNAMFITVSHVIETATGRKLGDLMREWIWEPLGMDATFFDRESAKNAKEHLANGYQYRYGTEEGGYEDVGWMALDEVSGAGAVVTNVVNYAKWARAIMNKSTPLSKEGFEAWLAPRTLMPVEEPFTGPRQYALGWRMGVYRGQRFYEHSGGMVGFGAELLIFPDIKFAVVALANTGGTSNCVDQSLAFHLVDEKLAIPLQERFDWNKKNQGTITREQHKSRNAHQFLYPHLPSPALPLSLPLTAYAGTYHHVSYHNLNIYLAPTPPTPSAPPNTPARTSPSNPTPTLRADRGSDQVTLAQALTFEHVSGEFFVARSTAAVDFGALFDEVYPVEFRIGADGTVSEVGVGWEASMGLEKIWLRRVAGGV